MKHNVLLPIIRKVVPQMIAQQLVSVQPMINPIPTQWGTGDESDQEGFPYWVEVPFDVKNLFTHPKTTRRQSVAEIAKWCHETFESDTWHQVGNVFFFAEQKQATALLLRWQ